MKKFLGIALVTTLLLTSCGGTGTTGTDNSSGTTENSGSETANGSSLPFKDKNIVYEGGFGKIVEKPAELKFFWKGDNSWSPKEDTFLIKWFEEETGVKLVPSSNPNAEARTDINLHATERFPSDIIASAHDYDLLETYASQGAFVNLVDYFDIMPNTKYFFEETETGKEVFEALATQDGELFLIPGLEQFKITHVPFIRKDWLEKIGKDTPQTTEELEEVLYAFLEADLGADGITIPMVVKHWMLKENLPVLWGAQTYSRANGKMVLSYDREEMYHGWTTDEFRNATTQMSKWYDDGIFSKELFTEDDPKNLYFPTDRGGATYDSASRISFNEQPNMPEGFELEAMLVPEYDGIRLDQRATHFVRRSRIGIPASSDNIELAAAALDAMMSREFIIANQFGVEGDQVTYIGEVDGKQVYEDTVEMAEYAKNDFDNNMIKAKQSLGIEQVTLSTDAFPELVNVANGKEYGSTAIDDIIEMYDAVIEKDFNDYQQGEVLFIPSPVLNFTESERDEINEIVANLDFFLDEEFTKAITGSYEDLDDEWWNKYLANAEKLGVGRLEEIYNTAYNR